ncbi:MAG TPA: CPBP family intramembrane metalloprotease, partial [Ilumatobacteraceae bacterium]|nr:CPBP family intramembrane metalloprotease [Ilumatobacteraceae bacterium]
RRGMRVGMVLFVATAAILVMALAMPAFADLFADKRVHGGAWRAAYHVFVRIPLGTVLLEEIALRSVLPAVLALRVGVLKASIISSALFGLWHVLPALNLNEVNPIASDIFGSGLGGQAIAVSFAVASTTLVGLWLCFLRYRAHSVLTTMLAHTASNSIAYALAWASR